MEAIEIALIQESFEVVKSISEAAAALFYGGLFEIAPTMRALFKGDMAEQGRKLMATIAYVVNCHATLSDLPAILPAASALAKKHVSYGVTAEQYDLVGEALLWTLEKGLGPKWTKATSSAWTRAYSVLSRYMIAEAYGRTVAAKLVSQTDERQITNDMTEIVFAKTLLTKAVIRTLEPRTAAPEAP